MSITVTAPGRPEVPPIEMPERFRHEVAWFISLPGQAGAPELPAGDYWISNETARRALDEGVVEIVSPLDSQHRAEIEISEELEALLGWLVLHQVEHLRLS
jgi:hypothetical protein